MSDAGVQPGWWQASDGQWYPPEQAPGAAQPTQVYVGPPTMPGVLITVGDIACTADEVITPTGRFPLQNSTWIITNQTQTADKIPTYAIVLAIVFFFVCLLGLLFLLMKEHTVQGFVQVSVQGPNLYYATQIPISSQAQVIDVEQRVNYVRGLVSALGQSQ